MHGQTLCLITSDKIDMLARMITQFYLPGIACGGGFGTSKSSSSGNSSSDVSSSSEGTLMELR